MLASGIEKRKKMVKERQRLSETIIVPSCQEFEFGALRIKSDIRNIMITTSVKSIAARTIPGIPHLDTPFIVTRGYGCLVQVYQIYWLDHCHIIYIYITAHVHIHLSKTKEEVAHNIIQHKQSTYRWAFSRRYLGDPVSTSTVRIERSGEQVAIANARTRHDSHYSPPQSKT